MKRRQRAKPWLLFALVVSVTTSATAQTEIEGGNDDSNGGSEISVEIESGEQDQSASYSLKKTEEGDLVRWAEKEFSLAIAPSGLISTAMLRRDLYAAAQTWSETGIAPKIELESADSNVRTAEKDGVNAVFVIENGWEFDPRIVALTFTHIRTRDGAILEMDMAINGEHHSFTSDDEVPAYDLQSVLTHELGHGFGLPDFSSAPAATMFGVVNPGDTSPRSLHDVDLEAIHELYSFENSTTNSSSGCPSAPPTSFSFLLLAFGLRRRLRRASILVAGVAGVALVVPLMSTTAVAGDAYPVSGWVVGREAPRVTSGVLPATDLVIRGIDGTFYRVRVAGKATGEVQPRVLHRPLPQRGAQIEVPAFATVLDKTRTR